MQSSLINKIDKARRYASEPHRLHVDELRVTVNGDNGDHEVSIHDGTWHCNCDFFEGWSVCSHTMAIERLMPGLVPEQPLAKPHLAPA